MTSKANSVPEYLNELPDDRKPIVESIRKVILQNLPEGFEEGMLYGMIGYYVPKKLYPAGYHVGKEWTPLPFINLASQKNYIALYHSGVYADSSLKQWLENEYPKHSEYKLDMGKSCIRFKKMHAIPIDLIGALCAKMSVQEWIEIYESRRS